MTTEETKIQNHLVSVIIPVRNGEATLTKCFQGIRQQTISDNIEIIVLDSMSTDKSRDMANSFKANVIDIPEGTFNHGLTRNIGVEYAKGELLYFTVQDAYLSEIDQLEKMVKHFDDEEVQSVTGIQGIPSDVDKNPAIWFKRFSKPVPEIKQFDTSGFAKLGIEDKIKNARWDNVNAMYRRSALEQLPFRETDFAEDMLWAFDALQRGFKIIRDSSLLVYHYHHQTMSYAFKVNYIETYILWKNFKVKPALPSFFKPVLQNVNTLFHRKQLSLKEKILWSWHNLAKHIAGFISVTFFKAVRAVGSEVLIDKTYHRLSSKIPLGRQAKVGGKLNSKK